MRKCIIIFLLLCSATFGYTQKVHKALFIIVDGIPADVIERIKPPALFSIARQGGYARAYVGGEVNGYSQTPTISAVGYNSLLTGTWVNKHNVWDNDIAAPNYHYWNIFRYMRSQYPGKKTAVFSTWLDNRTHLVGTNAKDAGNISVDYSFDGLEKDTVRFPHTKSNYIHLIDEAVADTAAAVIQRVGPDLSWVYLQFTDDMGHHYGDSPQMDSAVGYMDDQVKRIWNAVRNREKSHNEKWQVFITTDHGRQVGGFHHGGQSERERATWITTNAKDLNQRFKRQQSAVVDIMPTIANFLDIDIPANQKMEIDGVSLTGRLSATDLDASINDSILNISWTPINKKGRAKIWITSTNHFKNGGTDDYKLLGEVAVSKGSASFDIDFANNPGGFYKIAVEFPYNYLNRWIVRVENKK